MISVVLPGNVCSSAFFFEVPRDGAVAAWDGGAGRSLRARSHATPKRPTTLTALIFIKKSYEKFNLRKFNFVRKKRLRIKQEAKNFNFNREVTRKVKDKSMKLFKLFGELMIFIVNFIGRKMATCAVKK